MSLGILNGMVKKDGQQQQALNNALEVLDEYDY